MKFSTGNILNVSKADAIILPVSCYMASNPEGEPKTVLNSPLQQQATSRWPSLAPMVSKFIHNRGGIVSIVKSPNPYVRPPSGHTFAVVILPTRPNKIYKSETSPEDILPEHLEEFDKATTWIPGYMGKTRLGMIEAGLPELVELANKQDWDRLYLPRLGANRSGIEWSVTCNLLEKHLDDRFTCIEYLKVRKRK